MNKKCGIMIAQSAIQANVAIGIMIAYDLMLYNITLFCRNH